VFHELGRLPAKGDVANAFRMVFTVVAVSDLTIHLVMIDLLKLGSTPNNNVMSWGPDYRPGTLLL
jgi:Transporter associated domain